MPTSSIYQEGYFMKHALIFLLSFCLTCAFAGAIEEAPPNPENPPKNTLIEGVDENACRYYLSICAIFQDEAPYLREWIEFHRMVGVKHFYLYNNNSHDDYMAVLKPYIDKGIVELTDWPSPEKEDWTPHQQRAYNHCIEHCAGKTRWLAVIDIDEFMVLVKHRHVDSFLKRFDSRPEIGGVWMFWQVFGTSGVKKISKKKLLIESLTKKAPAEHGWNHHVKTICKPHKVASYAVHGAHYKDGYIDVNESGEGASGNHIKINKIRLHHYWTRDESFFYDVKIPRRERLSEKKFTKEEIKGYLKEFNQEKDLTAIRFVPELRQRMFESSKSKKSLKTYKSSED